MIELLVRDGDRLIVVYRGPEWAIPFTRLPLLVVEALERENGDTYTPRD